MPMHIWSLTFVTAWITQAKSGTPLICGSTHWAASIDVKEASKVLETPHTFAAMAGRQVSKVVMGPVALHGVLITKQGSAFTFGWWILAPADTFGR